MGVVDGKSLGRRIRDARMRANLLQEDLGKSVGLDRTIINKIESGARKVSAIELSDIALAINVHMSDFFSEPLPALVAHRSSLGLDTAESQIDARLARLAQEVEFLQSLGVPELTLSSSVRAFLDDIRAPQNSEDAERLAEDVRQHVGLGTEKPVEDLSATVDTIGLSVFSADIGTDTADAGTILLGSGAVSLINSHMKIGRRRLALAHELGHYLGQDEYTIDWKVGVAVENDNLLESRLDRFARALLLPRDTLDTIWRDQVNTRGQRTAAIRIASKYRVDMATLATRLKELRIASADTVYEVRNYRTTQTDIVENDLYIPTEELAGTSIPKRYARAILGLLRSEKIGRDRALDLLQGTFTEEDLPDRRQRRADEIWSVV